MSALEKLHDTEKAAVEERTRLRHAVEQQKRNHYAAEESDTHQLERAVNAHGNAPAEIEWLALQKEILVPEAVRSNILTLRRAHHSGNAGLPHDAAPRNAAPSELTPHLDDHEPTHANDAWLLSSLIYNWRHSRQLQGLRMRRATPVFTVRESARLIDALVSEYRGGATTASSSVRSLGAGEEALGIPIRSVRMLINRRGGELSELLRDFDSAFAGFAFGP